MNFLDDYDDEEKIVFNRFKKKSISILIQFLLELIDVLNTVRNKKIYQILLKLSIANISESEFYSIPVSKLLCIVKLDDNTIACGGDSFKQKLVIIDLNKNKIIPLEGHTGIVSCIIKFDNNHIICVNDNNSTKSLKIWNFKKMICTKTIDNNSLTKSLCKINETLIAAGFSDKSIKIIEATTGNIIKTIKDAHDDQIWCLLPIDKTQFASGCLSIKIWDIKGKELKVIDADYIRIDCLLRINKNIIASGSQEKAIRLYNVDKGICTKYLNGHEAFITCFAKFNKEEIISGSYDRTIKLWNYIDGVCLKTISTKLVSEIYCIEKLNNYQIIYGNKKDYVVIKKINI